MAKGPKHKYGQISDGGGVTTEQELHFTKQTTKRKLNGGGGGQGRWRGRTRSAAMIENWVPEATESDSATIASGAFIVAAFCEQ